MILDTTFLIDVLRGTDEVREWERRLDEEVVGLVTAVTVLELWEGINRTDASDEERTRVEALLEGLTEAAFDREAAMRAGELTVELSRDGNAIDVEDVMIAAIALERDEPVLTRNHEHFGRIEGLAVETY